MEHFLISVIGCIVAIGLIGSSEVQVFYNNFRHESLVDSLVSSGSQGLFLLVKNLA